MLKHTLLASLAAGFLAVAAVPASAGGPQPQWGGGGYFKFGGPDWSVEFGNRPQNCRPIVKKVKWWDQYGYPHWSQVVVGQKCAPRPPRWGWGGGGGGWGGGGGGWGGGGWHGPQEPNNGAGGNPGAPW